MPEDDTEVGCDNSNEENQLPTVEELMVELGKKIKDDLEDESVHWAVHAIRYAAPNDREARLEMHVLIYDDEE